jgi:hypothetical protein
MVTLIEESFGNICFDTPSGEVKNISKIILTSPVELRRQRPKESRDLIGQYT